MPRDVSYSPEAKRKVLYDFWKQYIGTPIVLLGGSIGGAFAIDFALNHPDAVGKLVLVDPQVKPLGPGLLPATSLLSIAA
jgi:pimeloyl-ACP methyl ester carboxylesterase